VVIIGNVSRKVDSFRPCAPPSNQSVMIRVAAIGAYQSLLQSVDGPRFLGPSSRARIVNFAIAQAQDIYGQMVVYLRLNGIVPPASRSSV